MQVTPPVDSRLRARLDSELELFLAARRKELADIDPGLWPVADTLESFVLRGGKRLRPAFAYWGCRGCGGDDSAELITAIAALELLHAGALIHDDVMDASDTRRGQPAVHRQFSDRHSRRSWVGDPESFGRSAAILLGDLCLVWSDEMYSQSGLDPRRLQAARQHYDAMRTEVMTGQYLDVLAQASRDTSVEQASKVARYKSAKYTVERPLLIGASLAGASGEQLAAYAGYGLPLGEAFQLRDDVLGVYGDPAQTGKPAGGDLREGKRTYLVAAAMEDADEADRAVIRRLLGDPALDEPGIAELQEIITRTGALSRTERRIADLTAAALASLASVPVEPEAEQALRDLATAATRRAR
ncbi:MAG: polyprenyl synthetase family protein [Micromonosporaceae bacterium]|nr:polyprenyl synthetase family protein [Micromonosporaceae bacterium]